MISAWSVADARYSQTCPTGSLRSLRCEENLRTCQGVSAKSLLMAVYMSCSKNQVQRCRQVWDTVCQWRSSPWLTPFSAVRRAAKGQPTVNSEPRGVIFIRGTFPTTRSSSLSFVSTAVGVPPCWGRIFWWPTDCGAEFSDGFVFIHKPSKCKVSFDQLPQKKKRKKKPWCLYLTKKYLDSWHHWGFFHSFL